MGIDILGKDILGIDILGIDIVALPPGYHMLPQDAAGYLIEI